jgi:hypothetical protein
MTVTLQRSPLTTAVLTVLRAVPAVVGDGDMPDANWIGEPVLPESVFEAFAVLSELTADHSEGPIGASQGDWRMPYMIEFFGISREQIGLFADRLRGALGGMRYTHLTLGVDNYKIQYVRTDTLGTPTQINSTFPSFWHQQDAVTIWVGKEIA